MHAECKVQFGQQLQHVDLACACAVCCMHAGDELHLVQLAPITTPQYFRPRSYDPDEVLATPDAPLRAVSGVCHVQRVCTAILLAGACMNV